MTDLEIYDRAIYSYLLEFGTQVAYSPVDTAMKSVAKRQMNSDHVPWSFISFYRDPSIDIDYSRANFTVMDFGAFTKFSPDTISDKTISAQYVQSIPINLNYQVDIWAPKASRVQDLAIHLVCKLHTYGPVLHAPMNPDGEDARFHMIDVRWNDNSDLVNEDNIGRIYRHTISFTLECQVKRVIDRRSPILKDIPIDIYEGDTFDDFEGFVCQGLSEPSLCTTCKWYKDNELGGRIT